MISYRFKEHGRNEVCSLPTDDEYASASLAEILAYRSCASRLLSAGLDEAESHALDVLDKTAAILREHMEPKYAARAG